MYSVGIDIGSVGTKAVIYSNGVVDKMLVPTGWSPKNAGEEVFHRLLDRNGIPRSEVRMVVSTGYGRNSISFSDRAVTEITCHATGAFYLNEEVRTVLDIGGQDSKVISMDDKGNVIDFLMNDKCAAGTGRFLQVMANLLGYDINDFDCIEKNTPAQKISSMCTVFAESEVVSLLAGGVSKEAIALGLLHSIANRVVSMINRVGVKPALVFTGGVSRCDALREILESKLGVKIMTFKDSQMAGALGASIIGWKMLV
jgi:predicted CoA-substrate-specific enzyme activase